MKENLWTVKVDNNASVTWNNIFRTRNKLANEIERQFANCASTSTWFDP